ncbi:glucose-1-phosphate thymidylyltransferase RfbA [Gammaproteobacteria bacterium]|nr:glucose-1-phosphate thymidylyltransferase RfbA [Gammaproteobacteria bacterium]MDB9842377.1 glucose-1-phosphate thymidylyltransferase RfbA [Gammaproteobacteria bacterium]
MKKRKGIVLAGGSGSRLHPTTLGISKQLIPLYDKPMIYYPLSVLMLAGIQEIAIIIKKEDHDNFYKLLGDGSQWGISIDYIFQPSPDGLAQAYILANDFLNKSPSAMILGDNVFYGSNFGMLLDKANLSENCSIFGYQVNDPSAYGVAEFNNNGLLKSIHEKPPKYYSDFAITGLYFLDSKASEKASEISPSERGELEITSLLNIYIEEKNIEMIDLGRGFTWLDTGTYENLYEATNFIRTQQIRQGLLVSCLEEIAFKNGWISKQNLKNQASIFKSNSYGEYLKHLASLN